MNKQLQTILDETFFALSHHERKVDIEYYLKEVKSAIAKIETIVESMEEDKE